MPTQRFSFQFAYDIEDPAGNRASAIVNVRIVDAGQPNRAPVAGPDVARTAAEAPVDIPVLINDFDPDGDPIAVESIAEQPRNGTVEISEDGTIRYMPNRGFSGTDCIRLHARRRLPGGRRRDRCGRRQVAARGDRWARCSWA